MNKKENQCKYSKNDLVYAKIRGYPWWPGIIGEIKMKPGENGEKKYELLVNFIGDHSHSMVNEDKLQKFHVKEIDFKNKKRKKLMQSIQIANDIHNGKYTYEEWRNRDRKRSQLQKKSKQNKDKKSQFNESNSEEGNSSDDQRESEIEEDEEYGPVLTARQSFNSQVAGSTNSAHQSSNMNVSQIPQQNKQPKNVKKASGKLSSSSINGHQYHEIEDEDAPSKGSSKLKNKKKNNKVIEDSEEEKYKGFFGHHTSNSDAHHGSSGVALNQNGMNSTVKSMNSAVRNNNSTLQSTTLFQNDPSAISSTSSSSHQQQQNSNSSSNFNNSNTNGVKNFTQIQTQASSVLSKNLKNDAMVIETDDDEEEEGGAIPNNNNNNNNNLMQSKNSLGNSTEKNGKTNNIPLSKLDETQAKYNSLQMNQIAQSSEDKNKSLNISKQDSSQQNNQQKSQTLGLKKQQSQEQKQNNTANIDLPRSIRSKQSSLVSNQQQVIEEEDDNSEIEQDSSSQDHQVEIKVEEYEDDSKMISNKMNESSQIKEIQSDDLEDMDEDSENNSNQRQTRASKRKQIKKSKNSPLVVSKFDKTNVGKKVQTPQNDEQLQIIKNGRLTRSRAQNLKGKKNKTKISSSLTASQTSNKQHTFLRTRSTVKGKDQKITTKVPSDDFPSVRTRKGSMRSQQNNSAYYSEMSISHSSPHISNNLSQPFIYHDQVLNLEDEFNQLFSHLQSMSSLDFSDTFSILQDIIYKIKAQEPKIDNIIGILGSDNGKLLLCAKNLLFNENIFGTTHTTLSTQQINELKQELDSLIDTLKALLFKRFFDYEEKLRLLKTVNSSSSKNREFEEFEKTSQKISPKGKKKEIENFAQQMSSSSSSCSVRPRKQSSSQQIKDFTPSQTQQFQLLSKDSSEIMIQANSATEKEVVQEQSLASLIQMQSEASLKMSQTLPINDLQQSLTTQKIQNSIDQAIISNSAGSNSTNGNFVLNSCNSYSLGATESFDQKIPRQQNSEQNYNDKIIDEHSENKCDKENNINNLTEDQKLMRRRICLKIIKPLIKILKDQSSAQNYAKNIEIMIRQKYPQMCAEYKNICKNLITFINQNDFNTTSEKIELYLNSNSPEKISILQERCSNYNGDGVNSNENLKNPVHMNDESNFSQHASRTPISCRKYSNISMRMEEEDNMNRYDNSSESGGHHDVHNQSQSGEEKSGVFEEFSSKNHQTEQQEQQKGKQMQQFHQQNKIIVDEEDDEEEVQVQVHQNNSHSVKTSPHHSQMDESKKESLINPVEQNQMTTEGHNEIEVKSEKMEEEEEANSFIQKEEAVVKIEEKQEETEQEQRIQASEHFTPLKQNKENEDNIQVEDDDDEEEEEIGSQYSQQKKDQLLNSSRKQSDESRNESCKLSEHLQSSPCDKYLQADALESNFDPDTSSNKPHSTEKSQTQQIENEHKSLSLANEDQQQDNSNNEVKAEQIQKTNNEANDSSSTPLLCDNNQNSAASQQ